DVATLLPYGLVVALADVLSDGVVETTLLPMTVLPGHWHQLRAPWLEQRFTLGIDSAALLSTDDIRLDPLAGDTRDVWKSLRVEQRDQSMEGICLALMRGSREQQAIGRCFSQTLTEPIAGNLVDTATQPVCFIHDHQVPASSNQILKTLPVVLCHLLARPSPATVEWLDRVEGTDDLRKGSPDVFFLCRVAVRCNVTRRQD